MTYSFFKDELALMEIRKHKWIESEKAKREIGFATAALDWIKKYGDDWKRIRQGSVVTENVFAEKRRLRRFHLQFPLVLKFLDHSILSQTHDLNLLGLSCSVPFFVAPDSTIDITIDFLEKSPLNKTGSFQFQSRVIQIPKKNQTSSAFFRIVLPFNEHIRDFLRGHSSFSEK